MVRGLPIEGPRFSPRRTDTEPPKARTAAMDRGEKVYARTAASLSQLEAYAAGAPGNNSTRRPLVSRRANLGYASQGSDRQSLGRPGRNLITHDDVIKNQGRILYSPRQRDTEIQRARYDFETRTFRTGEGAPLSDETIRRWAATAGGREAGAGSGTIKRDILLRSLARASGGERPGLLEQVLRQPRQLVGTSARKIFYSLRRAEPVLDTEKSRGLPATAPKGGPAEAATGVQFPGGDSLRGTASPGSPWKVFTQADLVNDGSSVRAAQPVVLIDRVQPQLDQPQQVRRGSSRRTPTLRPSAAS
jgi:hypothetical protein